MGLPERPTDDPKNQETTRRARPMRRPRTRWCLLKGCCTRFRPEQASERYCSDECREKAREWSEWKAQQKYRTTPGGQEKRKAQSRRYRERVRNRKEQACAAADEAARVISLHFFLMVLATGPAATRDSYAPRDRRGKSSVPRNVGARWSAFGSGNGDGESRGQTNAGRNYWPDQGGVSAVRPASEFSREMSLTY